MFFVTIILLALAVIFLMWGLRAHSREVLYLAACFLIAALGTGIIEYFALGILLQ